MFVGAHPWSRVLFPFHMHGTYTHRITCNLYPDQYFKISHAANQFHSRVAPFLRDAGLAYLDRKALLPASLESRLQGMVQEIRRVGTSFHQIADRANTYQRLTHEDLRKGAQLVVMLERQVTMLRAVLESLPSSSNNSNDDQVDVA